MLFRFSLYGFLKNQQYYEPFLILAFLEKGLSFFLIGLLVGFRELCITVLEIPSGAIADLYGRRRSMIFSFCAYIGSFVLFALTRHVGLLFVAMFLFALGDAFRTGTHKAMIFDWLKRQGRQDERTKVYGFTRSWSKIGSAVSALAAAAFVLLSGSYGSVFWLCIVPYAINIINFLGYPGYLDGNDKVPLSIKKAHGLSLDALKLSLTRPRLRQLFKESMLLEGVYKVVKDYLQPVLRNLALALPIFLTLPFSDQPLDDTRRSAVVVGVVFAASYLLMSLASRWSHRAQERCGGEDPLIRTLWQANLCVYTAMTAALILGQPVVAIICFIGAGAIQNIFRPAQISRFDACSKKEMGATILSVESQAKAVAAAVIAPIVGAAVDRLTTINPNTIQAFWPAAAFGILACLFVVFSNFRKKQKQ